MTRKCCLLLAALAGFLPLAFGGSTASAWDGANGHFHRWLGWGWGDGYHAPNSRWEKPQGATTLWPTDTFTLLPSAGGALPEWNVPTCPGCAQRHGGQGWGPGWGWNTMRAAPQPMNDGYLYQEEMPAGEERYSLPAEPRPALEAPERIAPQPAPMNDRRPSRAAPPVADPEEAPLLRDRDSKDNRQPNKAKPDRRRDDDDDDDKEDRDVQLNSPVAANVSGVPAMFSVLHQVRELKVEEASTQLPTLNPAR